MKQSACSQIVKKEYPDAHMQEFKCPIHGVYEVLILTKNYTAECPHCKHEAEIKQKKIENFKYLVRQSGINKRFFSKDFSNYMLSSTASSNVVRELKRYADNFAEARKLGRCLVLLGNTGTGKTHLSCAVIKTILKQGFTAKIVNISDMFSRLKNSWKTNALENEDTVLEDYAKVDLLVIDDIGVQYGTQVEHIFTYRLINRRYEDEKPTIIISNENLATLKRYLNDANNRVFDRLTENGGQLLTFNWGSYRAKNYSVHDCGLKLANNY